MDKVDQNSLYLNDKIEDQSINEQWKGIVLFNLSVMLQSFTFLLCQYTYQRNPQKLDPLQLLLLRSVFATLTCLIIVNKNLKRVLFDEIPRNKIKLLTIRSLNFTIANFISFYIIKYISLAFQGISANLTPIATMVLSSFLHGERFKSSDIIFVTVSLLGVIIVTLGIINNQDNQ